MNGVGPSEMENYMKTHNWEECRNNEWSIRNRWDIFMIMILISFAVSILRCYIVLIYSIWLYFFFNFSCVCVALLFYFILWNIFGLSFSFVQVAQVAQEIILSNVFETVYTMVSFFLFCFHYNACIKTTSFDWTSVKEKLLCHRLHHISMWVCVSVDAR